MNKQVIEQNANLKLTENARTAGKTVFPILIAISSSHMLNDTLQSIIPAIYPVVKDTFKLSFTQIGLITLTFQLSASLFQPFVGYYTDRKPQPYSLAIGMAFTLIGLVLLSRAPSFEILIFAVALVGTGSSIFHPEASRVAHMASGGRRGFAQSVFQVGGNFGSSIGPLLAAMIIVPYGQSMIIWFSLLALIAIFLLMKVGDWYKRKVRIKARRPGKEHHAEQVLSRNKTIFSVLILLILIFSKYIYLASMTSYYTFYTIHKFGVSVQDSQVYMFIFLFAVAAGTIIGGPLGDRIGRKYVIWASILGVAPFSLLLPHVNLFWTIILTIPIGLILASAFSAILVYAQELFPGKVGMISGLFFGFAFGMAGIGSAVLGQLADRTSIEYVYQVCAYLPLIGLITAFLPNIGKTRA
ncbi:MFS transporter [Daejeonella sp. H1SJ63]|jgi:FSR family fosmidomycin resistance protein-like MFS transporter|uniref:MFS transporter n=1 Tax=Daejeonella sp. H1SJ63 TaxID=3034145 RepID=UPI0023EBCA77|nr:MFS transporter [Daejeonella sp. H1SJ63]